MVRFIIKMETIKYRENATIYIPIWLDLLLIILSSCSTLQLDLHSNMVRFIIKMETIKYRENATIYIPIWLDLLCLLLIGLHLSNCHLHSNMVTLLFLFGAYNSSAYSNLHSNMVRFIIR